MRMRLSLTFFPREITSWRPYWWWFGWRWVDDTVVVGDGIDDWWGTRSEQQTVAVQAKNIGNTPVNSEHSSNSNNNWAPIRVSKNNCLHTYDYEHIACFLCVCDCVSDMNYLFCGCGYCILYCVPVTNDALNSVCVYCVTSMCNNCVFV